MGRIITLITDFRTIDGYMGAVYGVVKSINPDAEIVTISHNIPAGDIRKGSRALKNSYQYFPEGTVNIAVVDPTVGPGRREIIVFDGKYYFVGPDNGIFTPIYKKASDFECYEINNPKYRLNSESDTFHGRDVFAPAAAYISKGMSLPDFGPRIENPVMIKDPEPEIIGNYVIGKVVDIDTFGNLVTNISAKLIKPEAKIKFCGHKLCGLSKSYADVEEKQPLAYIGSIGHLEIAVNRGNAANFFGALLFDEVKVINPESSN
jgi:S-adenosylmethionine hydrolase